jgi:NDMA-dependent alcohol dehydrogenase
MVVAKAAVLPGKDKPFEIQKVEWDDPRDDEIGVRITACGVCHSDWHCVEGDFAVEYPIVCGHEGGGVVDRVGKNVTRVKEGDKVVMAFIPSCGHCQPCIKGQGQLCDSGANIMSGMRNDGSYRIHDKKGKKIDQFAFLGAFSEYVTIPEDGCIPVDPSFDLTKIAVVGCRVPTGWGAVVNTGQAKHAGTGMVVGLGGVGINAVQGFKSVNTTVIIGVDINPNKKKWAMEWGCTHFIDASSQDVVAEVMKITGIGVDVAIDAMGHPDIVNWCEQSIHKNGTCVWVGIPSVNQMTYPLHVYADVLMQKNFKGCLYGGMSPQEAIPQLLDMYKAGNLKLDQLITKHYRLDQINEAYSDMLAGKNICGCIRMD